MTSRLDRFNTLPPRPEHIKKVMAYLSRGDSIPLAELVVGTGLSRTQVLCAPDPMVKGGQVTKSAKSLTFTVVTTDPV